MDYAPEYPTPPPAPDSSSPSPPDAASDPNYAPSVDDLLEDIPEFPPLPKWNDPELRYMPKTSDEGQPPVTPDEAWRKIHNLVEKWDKGMCESYREQIDTLLVFAGLFSAVVTAFAVESYQWLQDDPADASAELLRQAVVLLSTLANQTSSAAASQRSPALPDSVVVRINVYLFLSLVLSLSAALIGIVCKQWLREYERDTGQSAQQALSVRQMKFDGLEAWRVGAIVTSVPLLLQLALALFLIGVSELLLHLHRAVGIAVTTAAGLTGVFYLITASAPLWQYLYLSISSRIQGTIFINSDLDPLPGSAFTLSQCPYKSPQAWLALRICQPFIDWIMFHDYDQRLGHRPDSWVSFDEYWKVRRDGEQGAAETTTSRALTWTAHALGETHLNAWRVICARHHLHQMTSYRLTPAEDVTQSLLRSLPKGDDDAHVQATLRKQVVLFSSSCRPDLDVNMSVELLLQLATNAPFDAKWFFLGLYLIADSYAGIITQATLHDDMAIELLRVVQHKLSSDHPSLQHVRVSLLLQNTIDISHWAVSRALFLPAACSVAVRFLQSSAAGDFTPRERADIAHHLLERLIYNPLRFSTEIRQRGFGHIVALAQFMLDNDPTCIDDVNTQKVLYDLGLRCLYEERVPRVRLRSVEDGMLSDTVSEHAEAHLTPDVQLPALSRVAIVSTAAGSALADETRLTETKTATHAAAAGRYCGDGSAAHTRDTPDRLALPTFGVSAASSVSRPVSQSAIELHDMPARAGDTDDAALTDPLLVLQQQNPPKGSFGVTDKSVPPHIVIPIAPPEMGASLSGPDLEIPPTSPSHDPDAPSTP